MHYLPRDSKSGLQPSWQKLAEIVGTKRHEGFPLPWRRSSISSPHPCLYTRSWMRPMGSWNTYLAERSIRLISSISMVKLCMSPEGVPGITRLLKISAVLECLMINSLLLQLRYQTKGESWFYEYLPYKPLHRQKLRSNQINIQSWT